MENNKEFVTGVRLEGDVEEIQGKLAKLFARDFNYFTQDADKPFSDRVMSDSEKVSGAAQEDFYSFDGLLVGWTNNDSPKSYVKDGLVLPEGMDGVWVSVPVDKNVYLEGDKIDLLVQQQGKVPGVFYVYEDGKDEAGIPVNREHVVFLDGNKVANAIGVKTAEVERGMVDEAGEFMVTKSKTRPEAVVERTVEQEAERPARKSVLERNIEAGYPDRIHDMDTGFNKVYRKVYQGEFDKVKHQDLFPRDLDGACPILADTRVNLETMTMMSITVPAARGGRQDVSVAYTPAVLEINLAQFDNEHTAYGPALAKDIQPGRPAEGNIYYMDVSHMPEKDVKALEARIYELADEQNALRTGKKPLEDVLLKEAVDMGARSPVLEIGKVFDKVAREREEAQRQAALEAEAKKVSEHEAMLARNKALKEEIEAKRKSGEYIRPEPRERIFVREGILEKPDKEKQKDYYSLKFNILSDRYEIRIPKGTEELGIDGKPLIYVKDCRDKYDYPGCHNIEMSYKMKCPLYKNGWRAAEVGACELRNFINTRNQDVERQNQQEREMGNAGRYGKVIDIRPKPSRKPSLRPKNTRGKGKAQDNDKGPKGPEL